MQIPTGDLETLRTGSGRIIADPGRETGTAGTPVDNNAPLPLLARAFDRLFGVLERVEDDRQTRHNGAEDITEIGEHALRLHAELAAQIEQAALQQLRPLSAALVTGFALWIARHDGRIDTLEPVVDALALLANGTTDTRELKTLSAIMGQIAGAVSPVIREDLEKINPGRPWRLLLLNYGIVTTRSHKMAVMEQVFDALTRHLPEDAARFFSQGMEQMEMLDYPPEVRAVMEKHHRRWTLNRTLH